MKQGETIPRIKVEPKSEEGAASSDGSARSPATVVIPPAEQPGGTATAPLASHYAILEKIGEGGMGVVYLGKDRKLGRHVAIKRLSRSAMANAALKDRFLREARAIAALNHIHIVHVYALGEDEDGPYIVMEYIAGPPDASPNKVPPAPFSLADRVNRHGPLLVNDAIDMIMKIGRAIEFAHECKVIHRDLKPSNILLDETGEPKIVDFGLARIAGEDESLTVTGEKMLSLGYGAPEQEQDASQVDHRADIYGLGAILYFSLTGKNPRYFRENDIPESLRAPVVRALETDRDKRWPTVREFLGALMMVKEPSKIELPTVKNTWRCKWCDTVNPVAIQFCGRCGWDGGEFCPECGAETRVGIQFCGNCGADAREYEQAALLLKRLEQMRDRKQFDLIPPHAERISAFRPSGVNGQRLVESVRRMAREAQEAAERKERLKQLIAEDLAASNYERVRELVGEYERLSEDNEFADTLRRLPELIVKRDLQRARHAINAGEWDYARRLCMEVTAVSPENSDVRILLKELRVLKRKRRARLAAAWVSGLFIMYVLSAAPIYRLAGNPSDGWFFVAYDPAVLIHTATFLRVPLRAYAGLFKAQDMLRVPGPKLPSAEHPLTETDQKMSLFRSEYEAAIAKIDLEYKQKLDSWPAEYLGELNKLKEAMRQAGEFEAWSAVKAEIDRFNASRKIPDDAVVEQPEQLRTLQLRYQGLAAQFSLEKSSRIIIASQDYINKLNPVMKDLTVRGRMSEAAKINTEIKRVRSSPEVTAAELEVEKSETSRQPK